MECHMIGTARSCVDRQISWSSWHSRKLNLGKKIDGLKYSGATCCYKSTGFPRLTHQHQSHIRKHAQQFLLWRTFSVPTSLEEEFLSSQPEDFSSTHGDAGEDSPEDLNDQPLKSDELKSLLVDSERAKLIRKLSEANQQNRFLKRQLYIKEEELVNFKSELAVIDLEIQALVALAEEITKSGIPEGSRKINGKYVQSHLLSRLQAVHEKLKNQVKDVEAAQFKEVPLFWCGMAESVRVMGNFDGWSQGEDLSPEYTDSYTKFSTTLLLRPGRYEIKFLVDEEWQLSPGFPTIGKGLMQNNLLIVE